jgi:cardiolipin synthase A/B
VRTIKRIGLFSAAVVVALLCAATALGSFSGSVSKPVAKLRPAARQPRRLTLVREPSAGIAPFLRLISGARHSVELTMYELYDRRVESALAAAARRGVAVRVLLNGGYYGDSEFKGAGRNGPAYAYLRAHRVKVRWTPRYFALTHQKTLTVDGRVSAVMTLNFDGSYASTRDFAVLDHQRADVRAILAAFDADWDAHKLKPSTASGDLLWSPGAAGAFESMINSARRSLDVENEELDYSPITAELCAAARRGVAVRVVMSYASDWASAFARLRGCGVKLHLFHGQAYYIHAKLLIADGRRAIVSSQNFSYASLFENRELGIRVTSASVLKPLISGFDSDYKRG